MIESSDTAPDCADLVDLAWAEMDEFFRALGARGPASTPEQHEQDRARFLEIQERCNSLAFAIPRRAICGHIRPPSWPIVRAGVRRAIKAENIHCETRSDPLADGPRCETCLPGNPIDF